ncbi:MULTISPECIES: hypothetical protein [unclassified Agromyces]|uniref:hypothetical protein n=1 Tax=unclassified Agromyces TaxID=2639701 RepID=UPI0030155375
MIRALLDRSVIALAVLAAVGAAGLWRLVSWSLAADELARSGPPGEEGQGALELMWMLPFLLSPAATTLVVAALVGLPLVVGARYAAIVRSRRDAP